MRSIPLAKNFPRVLLSYGWIAISTPCPTAQIHPHWTDVLGSGVLSWHRGSILASWRPTRSLRAGSLRGHVQSRACSAVAKNIAIEAVAVPQGIYGTGSESCPGT